MQEIYFETVTYAQEKHLRVVLILNYGIGHISYNKKYFSYFSTKKYVVGTQKNRLDEAVLLSTQNIC